MKCLSNLLNLVGSFFPPLELDSTMNLLPHRENSYRLFIICGPSPHFWSHPVLGSWQLKAEAGSNFCRKESDFKGELPNSLNSQEVITCMFGVTRITRQFRLILSPFECIILAFLQVAETQRWFLVRHCPSVISISYKVFLLLLVPACLSSHLSPFAFSLPWWKPKNSLPHRCPTDRQTPNWGSGTLATPKSQTLTSGISSETTGCQIKGPQATKRFEQLQGVNIWFSVGFDAFRHITNFLQM